MVLPFDEQTIEQLKNMHLRYLDDIKTMVNELISLPAPADSRVPDILGEVRALEVKLAEWRRSLRAETPDVGGEKYKLETTRKAVRSYNTAAILYAVNPDPGVALRELRQYDAVRLQWRWSELKKFFSLTGRELRVVPREVLETGEIDAPMVGEKWVDVTGTAKPIIEEG